MSKVGKRGGGRIPEKGQDTPKKTDKRGPKKHKTRDKGGNDNLNRSPNFNSNDVGDERCDQYYTVKHVLATCYGRRWSSSTKKESKGRPNIPETTALKTLTRYFSLLLASWVVVSDQ